MAFIVTCSELLFFINEIFVVIYDIVSNDILPDTFTDKQIKSVEKEGTGKR